MANHVMWLVLRVPERYTEGIEIGGIFDGKADAVFAARSERDIVGPVEINKAFPDGPWEGAFYPAVHFPELMGKIYLEGEEGWQPVGELPAYDEMLMNLVRCRCVVDVPSAKGS